MANEEIIDELKKIKNEIEEHQNEFVKIQGVCGYTNGLEMAKAFITYHIEKLKGE